LIIDRLDWDNVAAIPVVSIIARRVKKGLTLYDALLQLRVVDVQGCDVGAGVFDAAADRTALIVIYGTGYRIEIGRRRIRQIKIDRGVRRDRMNPLCATNGKIGRVEG
jgi:hypothetical protein